jgi:DNA repair protein RadA/Sms
VRSVNQIRQRVAEAAKLGFERCVVPQRSVRELKGSAGEIIGVATVSEALEITGCR